MQISSHFSAINLHATYTETRQKAVPEDQNADRKYEMREQSFSYTAVSFEFQIAAVEDRFQKQHDEFLSFLEEIGYDGTPITQLTQDEAAELVADEGFFGIAQTAERIANFVIEGAGDDEALLRAGREGVLQGFKEAESIWGGELPEISYKTIEKAIEMIDTRMHELGFSILNEEV
jgi:hypothetical protein